jgi:hypothetical protein
MRGSRAVCAAFALAIAVAGAGTASESRAEARRATANCGREEFVAGLEAVFGRFKTHADAIAFRNKIAQQGFVNGNVIQGCDGFRVVIRGLDSFDQGVDLQAEAAQVSLPVTLECIEAKDDVGELEAVFGHRRTRFDAQVLVNRAAALGFEGMQIESDPCGGYEVLEKGLTSREQAGEFVAEAKSVGFDVVIESS